MDDDLLSRSGLAARIGVSTSTISNWTTRSEDPLPSEGADRSTRIRWSDYQEFASRHPELRGASRKSFPRTERRLRDDEIAQIKHSIEGALRVLNTMAKDEVAKAKRHSELAETLRNALIQLGDDAP